MSSRNKAMFIFLFFSSYQTQIYRHCLLMRRQNKTSLLNVQFRNSSAKCDCFLSEPMKHGCEFQFDSFKYITLQNPFICNELLLLSLYWNCKIKVISFLTKVKVWHSSRLVISLLGIKTFQFNRHIIMFIM